jgi:RNA polymerase sigma-70 factor (ECF subfamily)
MTDQAGKSGNNIEQMLQLASRGDEDAWRAIVETYSARVYGLVKAQCGNSDLAEEITQSAFCTIVAKLPAYTEVGKFESWLFRIAMNRLRDEMRRRKRQAIPIEEQSLIGLAGGHEPEPPSVAADDPEIVQLRAAMLRLSEPDQRIIYLRHYGELSFKQIADVLGEPLGTVLARQHRALKKLAELMRRPLDEEGDKQA